MQPIRQACSTTDKQITYGLSCNQTHEQLGTLDESVQVNNTQPTRVDETTRGKMIENEG